MSSTLQFFGNWSFLNASKGILYTRSMKQYKMATKRPNTVVKDLVTSM